MKRLESIEDTIKGVVTYELPDGRRVAFDAVAVRELGAAYLFKSRGLDEFVPTERVPVMHHGRRVGTMRPDFDPLAIRSRSFLYDPRPGDFIRDGDTWLANKTLGPGDLDCVPGFIRDDEQSAPQKRES